MKRKLLIILLSLTAMLGCLFAFTACGGSSVGNWSNGLSGEGGEHGAGITRVEINDDGELIIYYTDGFSINMGKVPDCDHSYSEWEDVVDAACTSAGYKTRTCSICGYTEYGIVQPSGHVFGEGVQIVAPDCTHKGLKLYTCSVCSTAKTEDVPALNHDLSTVPSKAPSCTQVGWDEYEVCSRCDYTSCEEIPAYGHTSSLGTDAKKPFACKECGEAIVDETLDHYLSSFNGTYGYEYLGTLKEGMQKLYSAIDAEAKKFHVSGNDADGIIAFEIDYSPYGLTADEAVNVFKTYRDDNPLYYWMTGKVAYTAESLYVTVEEQYADGEARFAQTASIDEKIRALKNKYAGESSAYMFALAYHDEIINSVDYSYSAVNVPQTENWAHSICGVLDGRGAVCEGYAKTFQLLLNVSGVNNIFVTGRSKSQDHAWNLVEIEKGKWYWYDLTWDDSPDYYWGIEYDYLCATDESFLKNHTAGSSSGTGINFLYALPDRASEEYQSGYMGVEFTSNSLKYRISGYDTVSMTEAHKDGAVTIPETVNYSGRRYTVIAIGADGQSPFYGIVKDGSDDVNNCYTVTSISIPKTVLYIDDAPFKGSALESITVDAQDPVYRSVDGVLYTKSLYTLIAYPAGKADISYVIPDETNVIAYRALRSFEYLESLTIGKSVRLAGFTNWWGRKYPDSADAKAGNVVIGEWGMIAWALKGERQIIVHEGNENFKVYGDMLFDYEMTNLLAGLGNKEHYDIPEGVVRIESYAFDNRLTLKSVTFPESLVRIQSGAFVNCFNLERVHIPANVRYIDGAFGACSGLTEITVDEDNKYFASIGGILYNKALTQLLLVPTSIKGEVIIQGNITRIENNTFNGCHDVTGITLPSSVTYIGDYALWYCDSLTSINFGGTVGQWKAIEKGTNWNTYMGDYTVYCSNGYIYKG